MSPTPITIPTTVVIATYNRPDSLPRVLAGLADQDVSGFDVVVVDDGGKVPATVDASAYPFPLRLIRQANGGPGSARNTGIEAASGEVVIVVDDDMLVPPGFVAAHLRRFADGCDVVIGRFSLSKDEDVLRFQMDLIDEYFTRCEQSDEHIEPARLCTGNVSFRRALYHQIGGFDLSLKRCEDKELGISFGAAGARFGFAHGADLVHDEEPATIAEVLRQGYQYGEADVAIGRKHADLPSASPWFLLREIRRPVRTMIRALIRTPRLMSMAAATFTKAGDAVVRLRVRKLAKPLYGMAYALNYFGGAVRASGGAAQARADIAAFEATAPR